MLLTGDARGDKILEGLELVGLLEPGESRCRWTCSRCRTTAAPTIWTQDFFERDHRRRTTCSRATASTATPSASRWRCCSTPGATAPFTIHLTYPIDGDRRGAQEGLGEGAGQGDSPKRNKPETEVRPDWSPSRHGLKALFEAQRLAAGQAVVAVPETGRHLIELLEPLGY